MTERERESKRRLVGKNGKTKQKTRRIEGKIRSKAQIFARINGDDDDDEDDESQGLRMSRKISSIEASRGGGGGWKAAGSSEGHVAYENRTQKQQQNEREREREEDEKFRCNQLEKCLWPFAGYLLSCAGCCHAHSKRK